MTNYPAFSYISAITQALNAVVTFTAPHDFTDGEIISFRVSHPFGMVEINNKQARVLFHDSTTVTTDIDSSNFTAFTTPSPSSVGANPAICVPSASGIVPGFYTPFINLEDAFDNLPP